ncbi:MAG: N-acetyltransferase, partial [Clostridia bacterium]|nr:N-acetyltransferase [Deltaproteobacteria bacterium]
MATSRAALTVTVYPSLADIDPHAWDTLVTYDSPFVRHAFLRLLETSGCVGAEKTGWISQHLVIRDGERIVGAMPAYLRFDSYGEYIFDWSWAQAAQRGGLDYYPKVTTAVPFTPATGQRLLVHPEADRTAVQRAAITGLTALTREHQASSTHVLFCLDEEASALEDEGFIRRATHQYHFHNDGYATFDDFLATLRHENRKQIKKERRKVAEQGVTIQRIKGSEATDAQWALMFQLYRSTTDRKWGSAYLTEKFFKQAKRAIGDLALLAFAVRDGNVIAGTLSFEYGKHLFGRYWGALEHVDGLHFELCYYQLIEHAIANRQTLVEAGAQGEHKLKRGFVPVVVHSAHAFENKQLRQAIGRFCREERRELLSALPEWAKHAPFRKGAAPNVPAIAGVFPHEEDAPGDLSVERRQGLCEVGADHQTEADP